ncbi:hypothetical protein L581_3705 [Serratia fonticola AU-AP2C]|nr:hypothetical protein L581_3705 [Serratia fonticola AU-AP2C]
MSEQLFGERHNLKEDEAINLAHQMLCLILGQSRVVATRRDEPAESRWSGSTA